MPIPPAAKMSAARWKDKAPSVGTSLPTKRFRQDDPVASSSSSQAGGKNKRQNRGDMIVMNSPNKRGQDVTSRDCIRDEVGIVENDVEENSAEPDSGEGESDDSKSSRLG